MILAGLLDNPDNSFAVGANIWIKVILIVLLIIILRSFLVQRQFVLAKRLSALGLFAVLVLLVIYPDVSNRLAHRIGVGRGVDLLFYMSHLFLLLLIVSLWRRLNLLNNTITKLSRSIAIRTARKPADNKQAGDDEKPIQNIE
jgi:hypothetical protein